MNYIVGNHNHDGQNNEMDHPHLLTFPLVVVDCQKLVNYNFELK
jgi:hypothetical protein